MSNTIAVAAGRGHACALTKAGAIACWGANERGQLGVPAPAQRSTAGFIRGVSGATALSVGVTQTCRVRSDSTVQCVGMQNAWMNKSPTPAHPSTSVHSSAQHSCLLATTGEGHCWGKNGSGQLGVGAEHTCGITVAGNVSCWGSNGSGALGASLGITTSSTPVQVVGLAGASAICAGFRRTCVRMQSGAVQRWGEGARSVEGARP